MNSFEKQGGRTEKFENKMTKAELPESFKFFGSFLEEKSILDISSSSEEIKNTKVFEVPEFGVSLGSGENIYYNNENVSVQFVTLLSLFVDPEKVHKKEDIFEKKLLTGIRVLEIGSGEHGHFAKAAKTAGAEVVAVDAGGFNQSIDGVVEIIGDFNSESVKEEILSLGKFDFVTSIAAIGMTYKDGPKLSSAEIEQDFISKILKNDGYLYYDKVIGGLFKKGDK